MGTPAVGSLYKLLVEPGPSAHTFDTSSELYETLDGTGIMPTQERVYNAGMTGTRDERSERVRKGNKGVTAVIVIEPSPKDLDLWLPRIMGTAAAGDVFAFADSMAVTGTVVPFGLLEERQTQETQAKDCLVNKATFESTAGSPLKLTMEIIGKDWAVGTTFPDRDGDDLGVTAVSDDFYLHSDSVYTLGSSATEVLSSTLTIDNKLNARYVNSTTAGFIFPQGRETTLSVTTPYTSDETDMFDVAASGLTTNSIVYTNSGCSTTFTFGSLQAPPELSPVSREAEITLTVNFIARSVTTTDSLKITNDATP